MLLKGEVMQPEVTCPHLTFLRHVAGMNLKMNILKCVSAFLIHIFSAFLETRLDSMLMEVRGQGFNTMKWSNK